MIEDRIARAQFELSFAPKFDHVVVNDDLQTAQREALLLIQNFLNEK